MSFIKYIFQFFPTRLEFRSKPFIAVLKAIALVLVGLAVLVFVIGWNLFFVGLRVIGVLLLVGALGDVFAIKKDD
jgi:predicted ABC-type exoprotein transport system permease subunit